MCQERLTCIWKEQGEEDREEGTLYTIVMGIPNVIARTMDEGV